MVATAPAIHATAIAINGQALLLVGASGSGKSDLALRLIDRGAILISDDYCHIEEVDGAPHIHAVAAIAGKIEVRGVGIVTQAHITSAPLRLALLLDAAPERLPEENGARQIGEWTVPAFFLSPFEASAPIKAEYLLRHVVDAGRQPVRWNQTGSQQGVK
ncbi:MAG: HPr kinase/phosphorylase [Pseudomonadota bacterium]|jgi:serine kinase of HPr protein (carbohydrate metabolism regulator)